MTSRKPGAQKGHKGSCLSKADVEESIRKGVYEYRIDEIGTPGRAYITRYRLDLTTKRRGLNIFQSIIGLMDGTPVIS